MAEAGTGIDGDAACPLEMWHVGCVVADIALAARDYLALGAMGASAPTLLETDIFDATAGRVWLEPLTIAWVGFGRDRPAIELICPLEPDGPGSQARLLRQRPGASHTAYWCADVVSAARYLMRLGAAPFIVPLRGAPGSHDHLDGAPFEQVMAEAAAFYLKMPSGVLVELNAARGRAFMAGKFGEASLAQIPAPTLAGLV